MEIPKKRKRIKGSLSKVTVLVADADSRIAQVVKNVLLKMGFGKILMAKDGEAALAILRNELIDLVITDWQMEPMDGINMITYVRRSKDSPNRLIPIIMLTARAERQDVEEARDSGINEFIVKPFSAKTLYNRIIQIVEKPRNFVVSKKYIGPDRRHKGEPPEGIEERRDENQQPVIVPMSEVLAGNIGDRPIMAEARPTLKEKIGDIGHIDEIITPAVLEEAQKTIDSMQSTSLVWIKEDITTLENAYIQTTTKQITGPEGGARMMNAALAIKSRAGTFGFTRASEVSQMLYKFLRDGGNADLESHLTVMLKHIQVIKVMFANHKDANNMVSMQIINELKTLTQKMK